VYQCTMINEVNIPPFAKLVKQMSGNPVSSQKRSGLLLYASS
jgi:hypothetical protein